MFWKSFFPSQFFNKLISKSRNSITYKMPDGFHASWTEESEKDRRLSSWSLNRTVTTFHKRCYNRTWWCRGSPQLPEWVVLCPHHSSRHTSRSSTMKQVLPGEDMQFFQFANRRKLQPILCAGCRDVCIGPKTMFPPPLGKRYPSFPRLRLTNLPLTHSVFVYLFTFCIYSPI
jgi:hypothetical protein